MVEFSSFHRAAKASFGQDASGPNMAFTFASSRALMFSNISAFSASVNFRFVIERG